MRDQLTINVEEVARSAPRTAAGIDSSLRLMLLAARQHGVVARWQLERLRISRHTLATWLRTSRLLPLHRGVYAVGHRQLKPEGRWIAAVLAVGPGAVLSHTDGAALLWGRPNLNWRVEVTTSRLGVRDRPGIRVHLARSFDPPDVTTEHGIPVTAVARTLVDLADVTTRAQVIRAINRCEQKNLLDEAGLDAALRRANGRRGPGPRRFREARAEVARYGAVLTRSEAEELVGAICDRHGIPRPTMNHRADGFEIDAAYVDRRLGIEIDSYEFHGGRWRFVTDRRKLRALQLAGWRMLPFAAADLIHEEHRFVRDVVRALG